jgi:hypothetical protein
VADDFTERYRHLLTGWYDCVDRIVLNAYYPMGNTPGGFRTWWRRLIGGSDAEADAVLDNAHLMRLAGRFARRVRAWAADNAVPVIDCTAGERKHLVAEEYLRTRSVGPGVFLILVARAPAMVWDVRRSADGTVIGSLARKRTYVNHYSFHIMDRAWGHLVIKMAGHAPFGAQVIGRGDPERPRVRRDRRAGRGDRVHQGGELLTRKLGPQWARGSCPVGTFAASSEVCLT